ncbi:Pyrroline-5-carboxylate reductase 1 [Quillaja saponaria]|uniref:Pyrroline-5-carboxylate reductase 1 n=1 Tax=Quillaja saponaria TaxID=32244 RepID=A0AAD7PHU6_QUISA|nr:Pyrroline-5-carboxylate reductase 1 [Quillaja saponaria]
MSFTYTILSVTKTTTFVTILLSLTVSFYILQSHTNLLGWPALYLASWIIPLLGFILAVSLVIVAVRATMITWITVLVLLAFSGKRRRVLVQQGRQITTDVACATVMSFMAMAKEILKDAE